MSSSGQLCLKWNNHTSAFDRLLNNLHLKDMYSDGTIVCHGKFYPVHRFVLSTCSEYFEEIFRQSINLKSKHPFIIVKDIHPPQMEALLNYMYKGEVNVPQEMLPELIKAAEAFKIKGLAVPDDEIPQSKYSSSRDRKRSCANLSSPSSQVKKSKRADASSKSSKSSSMGDDEIKNCEEIETESNSNRSPKNYSPQRRQNDKEEFFTLEIPPSEVKSEPSDIPEYNDPEEIPEQTTPLEESDLSPNEICMKEVKPFESYTTTAEPFPPYENDESLTTDEQYDLAQSSSWDNSQGFEGDSNLDEGDLTQGLLVKASKTSSHKIHGTLSDGSLNYPDHLPSAPVKVHRCAQCPYIAKRKSHLNDHLMTHTGEKPFVCHLCGYRSVQKSNLKAHIFAKHHRKNL